MKHVVALVAALLLNATANLLMKVGATRNEAGGGLAGGPVAVATRLLSNLPLLVGLTCFGLNVFFYMYALQSRKLPISIAYPIMVGGGYALIAVAAHWHPALREQLNGGQKAGVALVLAGVLLIASQSR